MDFLDVVEQRRMVRNFTGEPVDRQTLEQILDVARRGPSAGFSQGQSFVVVEDPDTKQKIAALCSEEQYVAAGFDPFISRAPVVVVPCTNEEAYHRRYREEDKVQEDGSEIEWPVPYWFMDVGHAVMLLLLAVVDAGLAAGFAGSHDLDGLRALLNLPPEVTPVGVIPIGHPAPDKRSGSLKRGWRDLDEVVHWERW